MREKSVRKVLLCLKQPYTIEISKLPLLFEIYGFLSTLNLRVSNNEHEYFRRVAYDSFRNKSNLGCRSETVKGQKNKLS